ncbi:unnamed protein product [Diamesa tonsa]
MTEISVSSILEALSKIFPMQLNQEQIDSLVNRSIDGDYEELETQDALSLRPIYLEPTIMDARNNPQCKETLRNTHKMINDMMNEKNSLNNSSNWDSISQQGFSVERYLIFIYLMLRLYDVDPNNIINRDLAILAGRTYLTLLALPGAKRCQVWDSDLIIRCFKLFEIIEKNIGDKYIEILILHMLEECGNVFNKCSLNDHEDVKSKYIDTLALVIKYALVNGKSITAYDICMNAYKNLECLCRLIPDEDIENTMYLIFCRTFEIHYIITNRNFVSPSNSQAKHGIVISEFFIHLMESSSDKMRNVLIKFIKSILSNHEHNFKKDVFTRLLEIAARYELIIFWKHNDNSILEYLQQLSLASDAKHRSNGTEFCGRMLLVDSTPDQEHPILSPIPREVEVIKILFGRVQDKQDTVVLKALNALKTAFQSGNDYTKKIFNTVFNKQMPIDNPEILDLLKDEAEVFQRDLLVIIQTAQSPYIKKTSISLLEMLSLKNEKLVEDESFSDTIMNLTDDSSYLVKTQVIELVNKLMAKFPKQQKLLILWLDVILSLLRDDDSKIVENATRSLTDVFKKIESYENTDTDDKILPWIIIRLIMAKGKRNLLHKAFNSMSTNFLTQEKLRQIETHIFTSNRTEAWCLLSLIAGKMKSNNPDNVIDSFIECIEQNNSDCNNLHLILEVIKEWMKHFNSKSILTVATKSSEMLKRGECQIGIVQHLYEICLESRMKQKMDSGKTCFPQRLNEISLQYLLENFENFRNNTSNEKYLSYMLIYSESNTDLPQKCNQNLLDLFIGYIRDAVRGKISFSIQHDVPRKLNILITVLNRFAIRDCEIASVISPEFGMLLRKNVNISVLKNIMLCLNDLCKKHTATVEPVFKEIVYKLQSPNEEIRLFALEVIFELVMQDYIKLKGRVLLNLLVCTVDKNEDVALKAMSSILSYTNDKNPNLLYSCFLESVYIYNNFVQTEDFGVFPANELDANFKALYGPEKLEQLPDLNELSLGIVKHFGTLVEYAKPVGFWNGLKKKLDKNNKPTPKRRKSGTKGDSSARPSTSSKKRISKQLPSESEDDHDDDDLM